MNDEENYPTKYWKRSRDVVATFCSKQVSNSQSYFNIKIYNMNKQDKIKKVMREFKDCKLYVRRIGYD